MKKLQNKLEKKLKPFPFKNIGEVIILELEIKYHSCLKEYLNWWEIYLNIKTATISREKKVFIQMDQVTIH